MKNRHRYPKNWRTLSRACKEAAGWQCQECQVQNASNKLKQLWLQGYILRQEQSASSGGMEYEYLRILGQ